MREIKFRVWDNGLMKKFVRIPFYLNCEGYVYKDNDPHGVDMSGKRSVSPMQNVIAMQFTGLKDKNGKEVYEGDLITWPHLNNLETCEVYYNESEFAFVARPINKNIELESWLDSTCKVIGNVFENPDLINLTR